MSFCQVVFGENNNENNNRAGAVQEKYKINIDFEWKFK